MTAKDREGPAIGLADETETPALIDGLLGNDAAAIGTVAGWARVVAAHRAWGFETVDDIVQAALLAVVRNLQQERYAAGNFRAYVRRITKNICVSSYRRARVRGPQVSLEGEGVMQVAAPESGKRIELEAMVRRILTKLDDPCRRVIKLAYLQGLSRKEIAAKLEISETAAKVRLFRCMQRARALATGGETPAPAD